MNITEISEQNSLKSHLGDLLHSWIQSWVDPNPSPEIPLKTPPLKRSSLNRSLRSLGKTFDRSLSDHPISDGSILDPPLLDQPIFRCPIVYQSALFPWLASVRPDLGDVAFWEAQIITHLPQWQKQDFELAIVPRHGLKIGVTGTAIVDTLQQWLCCPPHSLWADPLPQSLNQQLLAKTGDGCELHYHHDRCCQLQALMQRQSWLPNRPPWQSLTWETAFQDLWDTDPTGRSLLETWIDQTDALDLTPHHLVTGIPQFLKHLTQYDRAHPWGTLAQTLPKSQFLAHCALIAASDRLLSALKDVIRPPLCPPPAQCEKVLSFHPPIPDWVNR